MHDFVHFKNKIIIVLTEPFSCTLYFQIMAWLTSSHGKRILFFRNGVTELGA